jgi:mannose-6-phosphate isomerase-like protein (cupin superfamily)
MIKTPPADRPQHAVRHRRNGDHKPVDVLFEGEAGTPHFFRFFTATLKTTSFSPRHHHNFDQLHFLLSGDYRLSKTEKPLPIGSVTYISEGVFYGPLDAATNDIVILTLQLPGASGCPSPTLDQTDESGASLAARGEFHDGIYTYVDEAGTTHNKDGYEAIWEETFQRPIEYPKARYMGPVTMLPDHFGWEPVEGQNGVFSRHLGTFNECRLGATFFKLDDGAAFTPPAWGSKVLGYVTKGSITEQRDHDSTIVKQGMAFAIPAGDKPQLRADENTEIYTISLPLRTQP